MRVVIRKGCYGEIEEEVGWWEGGIWGGKEGVGRVGVSSGEEVGGLRNEEVEEILVDKGRRGEGELVGIEFEGVVKAGRGRVKERVEVLWGG